MLSLPRTHLKKPLTEGKTNCMGGGGESHRAYPANTARHFEGERTGRFSSFDHPSGVVRIERHIALSNICDHLRIPGETEESP